MEKNGQQYSKQRKLCTRTIRRAKQVNEKKSSLEQLITRKNGFFKSVKNIASGTNHTSTIIDVDSLNDYFANIGKSSASGSD